MKKGVEHKAIRHALTERQELVFPSPFAGKYPTRISWMVQLRGGRVFRYEGKPSPQAIQRMLKFRARPDISVLSYAEVDRENLLMQLYSEGRRIPTAEASRFRGWSTYHPWSRAVFGWEWAMVKWWPKRIKIGSHSSTTSPTIPVYSPVDVLSLETHIKPYKSWFLAQAWRNRGL